MHFSLAPACINFLGRKEVSIWGSMTVNTARRRRNPEAWIFCPLQALCLLPSLLGGACSATCFLTTTYFLLLRLALWACLMLAPGCMALIGADCSSWGAPNMGTTLRSVLNNAFGYESRQNVRDGNLTISRFLSQKTIGRLDMLMLILSMHGPIFAIDSCW